MSSPSETLALDVTEEGETAESQLSSLVYDVSQPVQATMQNMFKMTNEIDQSSSGIMEEMDHMLILNRLEEINLGTGQPSLTEDELSLNDQSQADEVKFCHYLTLNNVICMPFN
ncbi:hypothetical protein MKW94_027462 [Papaver nudicaule]|uniref:Uncharacterized protein n=1 Tax=Papaver nudicaule TaxID=74823 RepID=A0AA42AXC0_PAPNU|nr:hypothetical protein [Papaver nudicaule]